MDMTCDAFHALVRASYDHANYPSHFTCAPSRCRLDAGTIIARCRLVECERGSGHCPRAHFLTQQTGRLRYGRARLTSPLHTTIALELIMYNAARDR
eukprot:scaffold257349_cov36-Tisochrysis_lutea.AAC.3